MLALHKILFSFAVMNVISVVWLLTEEDAFMSPNCFYIVPFNINFLHVAVLKPDSYTYLFLFNITSDSVYSFDMLPTISSPIVSSFLNVVSIWENVFVGIYFSGFIFRIIENYHRVNFQLNPHFIQIYVISYSLHFSLVLSVKSESV